jgi:hypothetical protein
VACVPRLPRGAPCILGFIWIKVWRAYTYLALHGSIPLPAGFAALLSVWSCPFLFGLINTRVPALADDLKPVSSVAAAQAWRKGDSRRPSGHRT